MRIKGTTQSQFQITPANAVGAPVAGAWEVGVLWMDSAGDLYRCTVAGTPGTWIEVGSGGGGGSWSLVTEATASRTAADNEFILVNAATCVITLPAPALNTRVGIKVIIATVTDIQIKTSGAGITIDGTDYSTNGLALTQQYEQINLISDGTNWFIY